MCTRFCRHAQLGIEIISLFDVDHPYPEHTHSTSYTIGYLLSGRITLETDGRAENLESGCTFHIAPNKPHAIYPKTKYAMTSISIQIAFFDNINPIQALMKLEALNAGVPTPQLREALCSVYANHRQRPARKDWHMVKVSDDIRKHPETRLKLDQIANTVYTSKYHFIRKFRRNIGLTPHRYQIQNQIRKAQRLLEEEMTIAEVALAVGFYDQSHFNKHFKSIVGMTPSAYKAAVYMREAFSITQE